MATNPTEEFLRAEAEAQRLATVLLELKKEVGSYKTAREALDKAAAHLAALADQGAAAARQLQSVVEQLRTIGTPEMLRRLEVLQQTLMVIQQRCEDTSAAIAQAELDTRRELAEHSAALTQQLAALQEQLLSTLATMESGQRNRLIAIEAGLRQTRLWTGIMVIAVLLFILWAAFRTFPS